MSNHLWHRLETRHGPIEVMRTFRPGVPLLTLRVQHRNSKGNRLSWILDRAKVIELRDVLNRWLLDHPPGADPDPVDPTLYRATAVEKATAFTRSAAVPDWSDPAYDVVEDLRAAAAPYRDLTRRINPAAGVTVVPGSARRDDQGNWIADLTVVEDLPDG